VGAFGGLVWYSDGGMLIMGTFRVVQVDAIYRKRVVFGERGGVRLCGVPASPRILIAGEGHPSLP
jgi:hypothetical protein